MPGAKMDTKATTNIRLNDGAEGRSTRWVDIRDEPFSQSSLVGSFFHGGPERDLQGVIVAEPQPGIYLAEFFSWMTGHPTVQELVTITEMLNEGWAFYDDSNWMIANYDHGQPKMKTMKREPSPQAITHAVAAMTQTIRDMILNPNQTKG
jgi:hypothetical protein